VAQFPGARLPNKPNAIIFISFMYRSVYRLFYFSGKKHYNLLRRVRYVIIFKLKKEDFYLISSTHYNIINILLYVTNVLRT